MDYTDRIAVRSGCTGTPSGAGAERSGESDDEAVPEQAVRRRGREDLQEARGAGCPQRRAERLQRRHTAPQRTGERTGKADRGAGDTVPGRKGRKSLWVTFVFRIRPSVNNVYLTTYQRGTGIRGLMRGIATLPQGN